MLPVPQRRAIAARIPNARLETLEDVGHMFWIERPERSAELVREQRSPRELVQRGRQAPAVLACERVLDAELVEHADDDARGCRPCGRRRPAIASISRSRPRSVSPSSSAAKARLERRLARARA